MANFDYKDISEEHLDSHINRIVDIAKNIEMDKITILTGGNALGKSLIRKQLVFYVADKKNCKPNKAVTSTSMQLRTQSQPEFGALSSMMHDLPWCSTSETTVSLLNGMISKAKDRFIVIDELEIGMSREVQVGVCKMLNEKLPELLENNYGIMVITHSEEVVRNLKHDNFINIEGLSEEEWINREIVPVDPEDLDKWAEELFVAVRDRQHKPEKEEEDEE